MIYGMRDAEGIRSLLHELNIPGYADNKDDQDDYTVDDTDTTDTGSTPDSNDDTPATDPNEGKEDTTDYSADIDGASAGDSEGEDGQGNGDDTGAATDEPEQDDDTPDYTADIDDATADNGGEQPEEGDTAGNDEGEDGQDNGDTTDYSADIDGASAGDGEGEDGQDNGDDGSGDSSGSNNTDDGNQDDEEGGKPDSELIGDASDQHLKNIELKQNFQNLYITCDDILKKLEEAPKTAENNEQMERIINNVSDLKDYVEFYITNTYPVKSYIDNQVNFQKYLTILNTVRLVLKDIAKEYEARGEDIKESAYLQAMKSLNII